MKFMEINILIEEGLDVGLDTEWLQKILEKPLTAEKAPSNAEISLVITGQERIQELNRDYRGLDQPTDVLSFSLSEQKDEEPAPFIGPPDGVLHLGEVIISYPQALIQARDNKHTLKREMAILIIHGALHILGYDHEKPEMKSTMQAREKEILESLEKDLL
jgi:probable rRNA maturation factor